MADLLAYRDGTYLPKSEIRIGLDDLGFERGFGVFDYMRQHQGRIPFLEDHLQRLDHSQSVLRFEKPLSIELVRGVIMELLRANQLIEGYVKVMITGRLENGIPAPVLTVYQDIWKAYPETMYRDGIKLIIAEYDKPFPAYKTTFYLGSLREMVRMQTEGAEDVLFYSGDQVRECSRTNIFIVRGGLIFTPVENILHGVTRKHVMACAMEKYMVIEKNITIEELFQADEVFISSTTRNIMPVTHIEDKLIHTGTPGHVTQDLLQMFSIYFDNYDRK